MFGAKTRTASHFPLHVALAALAGAMVLLSPLAASSATDSHSKFAGSYESEPPAANGPGPSMSASLGRDGTATITQDAGKGPFTLFGHWTDSGNQITVRFDATAGQAAPPPMDFQPSHGGLQAVTWDHATWGKATPPLMKKAIDWHSSHRHLF